MPSLVYIGGAALTPFGRSQEPLTEMLAAAAAGALKASGLKSVDALYLGVMNPEEFTGEGNLAAALADRLGIDGAASSRVETASSTGAGALESAFFAVASGYRASALVVAGEKMTDLDTAQATRVLAEVIAPSERRYGASMPALAALLARAYCAEYGLKEEELKAALAAVALKNHARGELNPFAQFQKAISEEKYRAARPVAEPLGVFDCAPITDGAAAVVLTAEETGVRLAGMGHATGSAEVSRRSFLAGFNSTRQAALQAYSMARVNPEEVDAAEVHDAFTIFEIIGSEDLGFFPPGQGWRAVLEGDTQAHGRLPINSSGGLKARGHPVGASGLAQVVEAYWLITGGLSRGRALRKPPRVVLTQSIGGLGNNNLVTILTGADRPPLPAEGPWRPQFQPTLHPLNPPVPTPPPAKASARCLAATALQTPPEGFAAPLGLCLARSGAGWATLAHCDPEAPPRPGASLHLELAGGLYQASAGGGLAGVRRLVRSMTGTGSESESESWKGRAIDREQ